MQSFEDGVREVEANALCKGHSCSESWLGKCPPEGGGTLRYKPGHHAWAVTESV